MIDQPDKPQERLYQDLARTLMEELDSGDRTFRLLGLSVSHPQEEQRQGIWEQLWLELEY